MSKAYLSLGANLGDRLGQLTLALRRLAGLPQVRLEAVSGVYETAPQGKTDQPEFLNCAARLETELDPLQLLAATQAIEQGLGRERKERWGPRTIDIDLLLYGEGSVDTPNLNLPHPRMHERAFVLIPLLEILAPSNPGVIEQRPALELALAALPDQGVRLRLAGASFLRQIQGVE